MRKVLGLTEKVTVFAERKKTLLAKIDTGADKSSIDAKIARELGIRDVLRIAIVKSAHGKTERPVVRGEIMIAGKRFFTEFTLADRHGLRHKALIGNNTLRGFLVDPSKKRG